MIISKSARFVLLPLAAVTALGCSGAADATSPDPSRRNDGPTSSLVDAPKGIGSSAFALCTGQTTEVGAPRLLRLLTRREYQNTLRDLLSIDAPDVSTLPLEPRVRGFDNNANATVVTGRHADEYLTLAMSLAAKAVRERKGQLLSCSESAAGCKRTFVSQFGARAFRRPLTSEEQTRYEALFGSDDFGTGMTTVITAMLVSPSFLYRSEVGERQSNGAYKLTPYEVASALSYLYLGSMPDKTLLDAAAANKLSTKAELETQARRLLADPRAKDQLAEFALQWLRSDNILTAFKDKSLYPSFSDGVRAAMLEEQRRFITDLTLDRAGKFSELFTADYVFANSELARFYGLTASGSGFVRIAATAESERGGLLGLGAVLASHAHSNESSPIKRGLFVRDRLLCQDLPPPPPTLDTTPPGLDPRLTTRERFAKHTADASCRGCHQYIDGVGFGLEGFDGVGQRRTKENNLVIDTSGELRGREGLTQSDVLKFKGPRELSALLSGSPSAQQCLTLQYFRFARGYEESEGDACSLTKLQKQFESSGLTLKELLVQTALLDSFTTRRGS